MQLAPNSTALAFDSARRRAAAACGRRDWSASGAASDVGDLWRPTHRLATREGGMGTSATNCRHTPACVRVRAQVPCLYGAALQWWPALSRLCGARCRQTCCGATVAAVHSFETPHAHAGVARVRAFTRAQLCPSPVARSARCPTRALLAPPCAGHAAALNAALCCVVRRSLTQVLRLVSVCGPCTRSAPASAVRSAARCGRRHVSDQDPRRVGLSLGARNTSVHTGQ